MILFDFIIFKIFIDEMQDYCSQYHKLYKLHLME